MKSLLKIILSALILISMDFKYSFAQDKSNDVTPFFSLQGTYVRHLGNFSNTWSNSAGFYAGYGFYFPENFILEFKSGYLRLGKNKDISLPDNSASTIIPVLIGGKYYFNFNSVQPYLSFTNGLNIIFQKVDLQGVEDKKGMQKYYWQAGMGTFINLGKKLKLDLSVNLNSHFYQDDAMMTGFEYMIGLQY